MSDARMAHRQANVHSEADVLYHDRRLTRSVVHRARSMLEAQHRRSDDRRFSFAFYCQEREVLSLHVYDQGPIFEMVLELHVPNLRFEQAFWDAKR